MKNLFAWRLHPSETELSKLWDTAIFVFDTNFLLDLYRVSRSTSDDFLQILESIQERIWLPYQVVNEFLRVREDIIDSEAASFNKAVCALKTWEEEQKNFKRLRNLLGEAGRIVSSELADLFDNQPEYFLAVEAIEKQFKNKIEELTQAHPPISSKHDQILEKLLLLFDGKVGKPYEVATLQKLHKEAEDRYKQEKPPGFKDANEKKDERKYGDFILWRQILDFARENSCPVILVTGEKKEDWWSKKNGEIITPHPNLRYEFQEQAKQSFWMYQTQRFLEFAKEKLKLEINPQSIEEVNEIAESQIAEIRTTDALIRGVQRSIRELKLTNDATVLEAIRRQAELLEKPWADPHIREAIRQQTELLNKPLADPAILEAIRRQTELVKESWTDPYLIEAIRQQVELLNKPLVDPVIFEVIRRQTELVEKPWTDPYFIEAIRRQAELATRTNAREISLGDSNSIPESGKLE